MNLHFASIFIFNRRVHKILLFLLYVLWATTPSAQTDLLSSPFKVSDVMIPMRDGVKLHTKIYIPNDQSEPLPFIILRTPYGADDIADRFANYLKPLADEGYIFVFQDLRGKFGSEGVFVMQRPARTPEDTKTLDEGTDTYDSIDWLLKNVPKNNGRAEC